MCYLYEYCKLSHNFVNLRSLAAKIFDSTTLLDNSLKIDSPSYHVVRSINRSTNLNSLKCAALQVIRPKRLQSAYRNVIRNAMQQTAALA